LRIEEKTMERRVTFYEETNFKTTEIGEIPEDWEVVKLGEVAEVTSGGSAPQGEKYFINGHNPFVRVQHIDNTSHRIVSYDLITDEAVIHYRLKKFQRGTIVFPKSGASVYLEKRAVLPIDAYLVSHLCAVNTTKVDVMQQYLFYALENVKLASNKADGYPTLNLSEIKKTPIPLPPLEEQKAIAYVLSTVQDAREKTEKVINATKQLKKALMKHLFTYGPVSLEEAELVNLKETEIGLIPEDWEVTPFREITGRNRYHAGKVKQSQYRSKGKFPVVDQGQDFIAGFCDEADKVYSGPLPVIIFGDHTRIFKFVDFPFVLGADGTKLIIPDSIKCNPRYMYYALLNIDIPNRGYNRHYSILRGEKLPLPPLPVQQRIAEILQTVDEKIQAEEKKKHALDNLFNSMLHVLMSGKLRVKFKTAEGEESG